MADPVSENGERAREHAEHLRSVHFALVGACFTVAVAAVLSDRGEIDRAVEDVREIHEALSQWAQSPDWLDAAAQTYLHEKGLLPSAEIAGALSETKVFHLGGRRPHFHQLVGPWFSARSDQTAPIEGREDELRHRELLLPAPTNLSEFRRTWDQLDAPLPLRVPLAIPTRQLTLGHVINFTASTTDPAKIESARLFTKLVLVPHASVDDDLEGALRKAELGSEYRSHAFQEVIREPRPNLTLLVPTRIVAHIDGQAAATARFKTNWRSGRFAMVFSELDAVTQRYQDVKIATLREILESEQERAAERLELFGTTLPSSDLLRLALPVIALIQIYLLLHLVHFCSRWTTSVAFPWIALYGNWPAIVVTLGSTIALPVTLVLTIGIADAARTGASVSWSIALAISLVSLGAAIGCLRTFMRLWTRSAT